MKKIIVGVTLLFSVLGFSQSPIRTEKVIKTRIMIHNRLYAEAELGQDKNIFFFKCVQFQGISIIKPFQLTPNDTERLYNALNETKGKNGQILDIPTLDKKLLHIEYCKTMFKTYAVLDIVDKENDAIYHVFCLPKIQLDRLFNKK